MTSITQIDNLENIKLYIVPTPETSKLIWRTEGEHINEGRLVIHQFPFNIFRTKQAMYLKTYISVYKR